MPLPCPFPGCGGGAQVTFIPSLFLARCVCVRCMARGPACSEEADAVAKWNAAPRKGDDGD